MRFTIKKMIKALLFLCLVAVMGIMEPNTVCAAGKNTYTVDKAKVRIISNKKKTAEYVGTTNKNLSTIKIPDTITIREKEYKVIKVSNRALVNNKKVKKILVGSNVTSIGKDAFRNCKQLKTVAFQSTDFKRIGEGSFRGDKKLTKIIFNTYEVTKKSIGKNAIKGTNKKLVIEVPEGMTDCYNSYFKGKGNKTFKVKKHTHKWKQVSKEERIPQYAEDGTRNDYNRPIYGYVDTTTTIYLYNALALRYYYYFPEALEDYNRIYGTNFTLDDIPYPVVGVTLGFDEVKEKGFNLDHLYQCLEQYEVQMLRIDGILSVHYVIPDYPTKEYAIVGYEQLGDVVITTRWTECSKCGKRHQ